MPVVPFTPRNLNPSRAVRRFSSSISSSCSQRQARFPTVVSWAGCRWVKPSVGSSLCSRANPASLLTTRATWVWC